MRVFTRKIQLIFVLLLCGISAFGQVGFTASSTSGCAPFPVTFTNNATTGSFSWDLGNGNTSLNINASAVYNDPGQYTVILTGAGGQTASTTITVFQSPSASFTVPDDTICTNGAVEFTSTSTPGSGNIVLYIWNFGDGSIDSSTTPSINHIYPISGSFTTNVVVIDQNNCQSPSANFTIHSIQRPTASFNLNPTGSCTVPVTVSFTNTTTPTANYTYSWNFGDPSSANNTSSQASPSHQYNTANTYTIKMIVALGGCIDSTTRTFAARPLDARFLPSNDSICIGDQVQFTDSTLPVPSTYVWNFGDPQSGAFNTSTAQNPAHTYNFAGTFTVLQTVTLGSCTDTVTHTILVRPRPNVSFTTNTDSTTCQPPFSVSFSGSSTSTITNWSWNFGDGATSVGQNANHNYNAYGSFSVFLTVTDTFGCTATFSKPNHVQITRPTVEIITLADSGCVGTTFTFDATSTVGAGDSIQSVVWNFGDGTGNINGTLTNMSHTFNTPGQFDISVTITTRDGCTVTATKIGLIKIGNKPVAAFSFQPAAMCYGDTVFFTDLSTVAPPSTITGWQWSFGSSDQNPPYVFPDTGVWSVTLMVYSFGCADTLDSLNIITIFPPKPQFSVDYDCNNPFNVQFTDLSHGDTQLYWYFGDGVSDSTNIQNPLHVYPGRGNYTATLTAINSASGCRKDTTLGINITIPIANITATPAGCAPFTSFVSGASSQDGFLYNWTFGDPASAILNGSIYRDTLHYYSQIGAYLMTLDIFDVHGCPSQDTLTVFANGPIADFTSPDVTGCRPFSTTFNYTGSTFGSTIANYSWNFNHPFTNDLGSTTNATIPHSFANTGTYTVQLTVTDQNGCTSSIIRPFYINVTFPTADLNGVDTFVCDNVPVPLTVNMIGTGPYSINWSFGDGTTDTLVSNVSGTSSTIFHSYPSNNTVNTLTVTVSDVNGCDTTLTKQIRVLSPDPDFTVATADSCGYTTGSFFSNTTTFINQWVWNINGPFNYTGQSALPNPQFQYTIPGWYGGTLTVTNPGCTRQFTRDSLFLVPGPQGFMTYVPDTGCSPISIDFTTTIVSGTYDYIQWDFGDGNTAETQSPGTTINYTYYQDGVYYPRALIAYTVNGRQCFVNDTNLTGANSVVSTLLDVDATLDIIATVSGGRDTLSAVVTDPGNNVPYTYVWNAYPGTGTFTPIGGIGSLVEYTAGSNNSYVVVTVRDNSGCQAYDTIQISLKPCDTTLDSIPNVFTPDNDGRNDQYYITNLCSSEKFRIVIYNRWGRIVYESDDPFFRWDGKTTDGTDCSEGVYYYTLALQTKELHGWIELIRNKR